MLMISIKMEDVWFDLNPHLGVGNLVIVREVSTPISTSYEVDQVNNAVNISNLARFHISGCKLLATTGENVIENDTRQITIRLKCSNQMEILPCEASNENSLISVSSLRHLSDICCVMCGLHVFGETCGGHPLTTVLPLPTSMWEEMGNHSFCHTHAGDLHHREKFLPKPGQCFIGDSQILIGQMDEIKTNIKSSSNNIFCYHCGADVGTYLNAEIVKLYLVCVCKQPAGESIKLNKERRVGRMLCEFIRHLNKSLGSTNFTFRSSAGSGTNQSLPIQLQVLSTNSLTSHLSTSDITSLEDVHLALASCCKLLWSEVEAGNVIQETGTTHVITCPREFLLVLHRILTSHSMPTPSSSQTRLAVLYS